MHSPEIVNRFWANVDKRGDDECWPWLGTRHKVKNKEYGVFYIGNEGTGKSRNMLAHRFAHEEFTGPIPDGLLCCHHCDHPWCVNPKCLYAGTPAQNTADMMRKNRCSRTHALRGETNGNARLKDREIPLIRKAYVDGESMESIATHYGVSENSIRWILIGKRYTSVKDDLGEIVIRRQGRPFDDQALARNLIDPTTVNLARRGEAKGKSAKLKEDDIRAIRAAYATGGKRLWQIADQYGVVAGTIGKIVRGERWAHVI